MLDYELTKQKHYPHIFGYVHTYALYVIFFMTNEMKKMIMHVISSISTPKGASNYVELKKYSMLKWQLI